MFMIKKGFVLFFPMEGNGHYRIVGIVPGATEVSTQFNFTDMEGNIKEQVQVPVTFEKVKWFSSYKVHSRKAGSFENGRCYIAGDAAHIHTPAGGQGMNTGIQDAYNLAWKIAYTLRGEVKDTVLKSYSTERGENAKHLLQTTDRMFDMMAGRNAFWDFIRLHFFARIIGLVTQSKAIKKRVFPLISQTGISYKGSMIIKSSVGKVKAGVRMPYFTFANGKQIFNYISEPAFKLLFFGDKDNSQPITGIHVEIVTKHFEEIPASLFGREKNFYILLRPDNHIAYIGKDLNACKEFLSKISSR